MEQKAGRRLVLLLGLSLALLSISCRGVDAQCINNCPTAPEGSPDFYSSTLSSSTMTSITVAWDAFGSSIYQVEYRRQNTDTFTVSAEISGTSYTIDGLMPSTDYEVRVCLFDTSDCGNCLHCISTQHAEGGPGSLLVVSGYQLQYLRFNNQSFEPPFNYLNLPFDIDGGVIVETGDTDVTIDSIDYHYRREEIYASFSNGTIVSFSVNVTVDDIIDFTHTGTDVIYTGRGSVVTMAVEWVTDILYWMEFDGVSSQLYSGSINGGNITTIGQSIEGEIGSLKVDIIYGYLYFVVISESLVRLPLSVVNSAQSDTNLIDSATILESNNAISAFTIDLANSQTFLTYGFFIRLSNLNGEVRETFDLITIGDTSPTTQYLASYGSTALVVDPIVRARNVQIEGNNANVGVLESASGIPYTAASLFQPAYQPLPAGVPDPPEIELIANSDTLRWNMPPANGRDIIMYRLFYSEVSGSGAGIFESGDPNLTEIDLSNVDGIQERVEYEYSLVAINGYGPSNMSNTITHLIVGFWTTENIIAVAVGGGGGLLLFIVMCIICMGVVVSMVQRQESIVSRWSHRQARKRRVSNYHMLHTNMKC